MNRPHGHTHQHRNLLPTVIIDVPEAEKKLLIHISQLRDSVTDFGFQIYQPVYLLVYLSLRVDDFADGLLEGRFRAPCLGDPDAIVIHSAQAGSQVAQSVCSATSFLRNWDSILEKKRANLRSISEPARLRQPPPRSTGAAHARGRAQSIREERRIAAPPVLFALLWVRLLPALYGPFCGPLRPFGGCPWGVTPPARECLPPAPPDTRRRG